jgi:hypothetical protein
MKHLVLASALLLSSAVPVVAAESPRSADAVLVAAPAAPAASMQTIIDGRLWRCFGTGCRAAATSHATNQSAGRECRRVAAQLGELAHYRTGKRVLSAAELANCNTAAPKRPATAVAATQP